MKGICKGNRTLARQIIEQNEGTLMTTQHKTLQLYICRRDLRKSCISGNVVAKEIYIILRKK